MVTYLGLAVLPPLPLSGSLRPYLRHSSTNVSTVSFSFLTSRYYKIWSESRYYIIWSESRYYIIWSESRYYKIWSESRYYIIWSESRYYIGLIWSESHTAR